MISYGENRPFVCRTSRDHRDDDSTSLRRHGRHAVREAYTDSLRRNACHDIRHGQDSDEDSGGLLRYTLDGSTPTGGLSVMARK